MTVTLPSWEDEVIRIEPLTMAHLEFVIALRNNDEVRRYSGRDPFGSHDEALAFVQKIVDNNQSGQATCWVIIEKSSGYPVGNGGAWRMDQQHNLGEIGYSLLPPWWGKGYISRALPPMLDYLFTVQGLHRIEANVDPRNTRSASVLQRLGFHHEGRFRQNHRHHDDYLDSDYFGLLRPEWHNPRQTMSTA